MIEIIPGLPSHVAGFAASGRITRNDYDQIIYPEVDRIYKEFGKINYLLLINTPLENYSAGAWFKDALLGFVYFTEWRRIAIVSEKAGIRRFTNIFGTLIPGKTKGFRLADLDRAETWVSAV